MTVQEHNAEADGRGVCVSIKASKDNMSTLFFLLRLHTPDMILLSLAFDNIIQVYEYGCVLCTNVDWKK